MKKVTISLLLLSFLIITPIHSILANDRVVSKEVQFPSHTDNKGPVSEKTKTEGLLTAEEVLMQVKEHFIIPKELDTLHTNFQEDRNTSVWSFQWFSKSGKHGEIVVRADAKTGSIVSYHQYAPEEYYDKKYQSYVPKFTWEQGLLKAQQAINRLSNKQATEYQLISEPQYLLNKGLKHYEYRFEQTVAGIPFKNQTIQVTINADTGELRNYYMNWLENLTTNQQSKITKQDAEKLFKEQSGLELAYIAPYSSSRDLRDTIRLVYRPIKSNQFVVDATTGELIEPSHSYYNQFGNGGDMAKEMMDIRGTRLEEFEQAELDSISGMLNQEQALVKAMSYVEIPSQYKQVYSNMERNWDFPQNRTWNFRWEFFEQDKEAHSQGTIEVAVDAITGKLVKIAKYQYPDENQEVVKKEDLLIKNEDEAMKKVQDFIKKHYPEHMDAIEIQNTEGWKMLEGQELPLTYHFRFQRIVNDISFDRNLITVNISAKTGEIPFFQIVWADVEFPSPTGVIDAQTMVDTFLTDNPIELQYNKYFDNREQVQTTRLVYAFSKQEMTLYDAMSGVPLEPSGVEKKQKPTPYKDVLNHWALEDIRFLEKYEVLPFQGENLIPNQPITQGEFMEILLRIERPYVNDIVLKELNQYVMERRLYLDDDSTWDDSSILSREDMAYLLITFLNYQEISNLDIYNVTFADETQISHNRRGSIAIINGLGIMTGGSNNQFMPVKQASRAEAITTIVKLLRK